MSEWAEWRDKQNFAIILQTEAAELAWNHKQAEVDRLKYPDNCAIEIDGKGYYIEPAAYRKIKSLQADVDRYQEALTKASLHFRCNTKYGRGWHDALAYINQTVKPEEKVK